MGWLKKLFHFGYQQALSTIFPVAVFASLALSKFIHVPFLHRYDFILLICLLVQVAMYYSGLESKDELKVIAVFHLIGLALELYKVHMGSWAYPEEAWSKVGGVPLYSGFMYASVASYMTQAWRRLELKLHRWPSQFWSITIGVVIYLNFFTHHFIADLRWVITALLFVIFIKTKVEYRVLGEKHSMPLVLSFFLIGFFVWLAENIVTFFGGWQYPDQKLAWVMVHLGKISSWFLLVVVSFIIVAQLKHVKEGRMDQGIQTERALGQ